MYTNDGRNIDAKFVEEIIKNDLRKYRNGGKINLFNNEDGTPFDIEQVRVAEVHVVRPENLENYFSDQLS